MTILPTLPTHISDTSNTYKHNRYFRHFRHFRHFQHFTNCTISPHISRVYLSMVKLTCCTFDLHGQQKHDALNLPWLRSISDIVYSTKIHHDGMFPDENVTQSVVLYKLYNKPITIPVSTHISSWSTETWSLKSSLVAKYIRHCIQYQTSPWWNWWNVSRWCLQGRMVALVSLFSSWCHIRSRHLSVPIFFCSMWFLFHTSGGWMTSYGSLTLF